jgi:hypothetical protein
MSDDRDHTIATATVTSEETPYGVRINSGDHALRGDEPVGRGGADSGPGGNRDPHHHRDGLTGGDVRDGAARAAGGALIP